jgi:hypothetical protein
MLILAQAKLLDICIKNTIHPSSITQVDGVIPEYLLLLCGCCTEENKMTRVFSDDYPQKNTGSLCFFTTSKHLYLTHIFIEVNNYQYFIYFIYLKV